MRLSPKGDLHGAAVAQLLTAIVEVIVVDWPDELVIDLDLVVALSPGSVQVLMAGYLAAIERGVSYRVVNARGHALHVLRADGIADVLADSDDIAALMIAVLTRQHPPVTA